MALLSDAEIAAHVATLDGWARTEGAIRKVFTWPDFPAAVDFVRALVPPVEAADHHPDIAIHYRRVTLTFTTHSAGGLTAKDIDGARAADGVAAGLRAARGDGGAERDG